MPYEQLNGFLLRCWVVHNQAKFHGRREEQLELRRLIERMTAILRIEEESQDIADSVLAGITTEIRQIHSELPDGLRAKLPALPQRLCSKTN
ncbi:MAG: hypothetical protein ACYTG5_19570 [Planctomycetota bacterium]|jgi:hypothetical protein